MSGRSLVRRHRRRNGRGFRWYNPQKGGNAYTNSYANGYVYSYSDSHGYLYAYANCYGNSDGYRYGNPPAYPDAAAASDSGTSPNAVETIVALI